MKRFTLPVLLILSLAACAPAQVVTEPSAAIPQATPQPATVSPTESAPSAAPEVNSPDELTRLDEQGAIIVEVTPLNLGTATDTLEFDVAMNTHSVDLSMDLATLATLTTDTGITVSAATWDAPRGGHHVQGKLIFLATKDGVPVLEGVSRLTLTIANLDAPSRVFEWELN